MDVKTVEPDSVVGLDRLVEAEVDRQLEDQKELEAHFYHYDYRGWCRWCKLTRMGGV